MSRFEGLFVIINNKEYSRYQGSMLVSNALLAFIFVFYDLWHHKKPYSSFTLNTIPPHAGPFKTRTFEGLFAIINSYSANKADMHCSHPIFKTLSYFFREIMPLPSQKTILIIDVEYDFSAREAVQNEQVCGIVFNYKQLFSNY